MKMGKPHPRRGKNVIAALKDMKITAQVSLELPGQGAADVLHLVIDNGVPTLTLDDHQDIEAGHNLLCYVLHELQAIMAQKKH